MGSCVGYFMTFDCPVAPKPRGVQTSLSPLHTSDHLEGWRQIILAQGIPFMTSTTSSSSHLKQIEVSRTFVTSHFCPVNFLSAHVCTCHLDADRKVGWGQLPLQSVSSFPRLAVATEYSFPFGLKLYSLQIHLQCILIPHLVTVQLLASVWGLTWMWAAENRHYRKGPGSCSWEFWPWFIHLVTFLLHTHLLPDDLLFLWTQMHTHVHTHISAFSVYFFQNHIAQAWKL